MTTYKDLLAQKAALDEQIANARREEITGALATITQLISDYGLSQEDIFPSASRRPSKNGPVAPKYRDPDSGKTWTGRGKPPTWIKDKDRSQFAI